MQYLEFSQVSNRKQCLFILILCATGTLIIIVSKFPVSVLTFVPEEARTYSPYYYIMSLRNKNTSKPADGMLGNSVRERRNNFEHQNSTWEPVRDRFRLIPNCTVRYTGVEDILCMEKPDFLPQFRNPCWLQDGRLRCLPYFQIIGVCKSGTSDLFRRLTHHPHVLANKGILNKELWYWTWFRYGETNNHRKNTHKRTLDQFIDSFNAKGITRIWETDKTYAGGYYFPAVTGHGDPMDFWDQASWTMIQQNDPNHLLPEVTTPSLIKHVNPDIKLILMLRDPVERLFSHYLHGKYGTSAAQFHEDVVTTIDELLSCNRTLTLKACLFSKDIGKKLKVPISASFYSVHLSEWLRVFPRKQIQILRTEDFSKDIATSLLNIFRFLKLDPIPSNELYRISTMPHFYYTTAKKYAGAIWPKTIHILNKVFEPYNRQLAAMLNDTRYLWTS